MTSVHIIKRLNDLRMARDFYTVVLNDEDSIMYKDNCLREILKKTKKEIDMLEEVLYNGECEDDQHKDL